MKPSARNLSGFLLASAITAAAWMALWPWPVPPPPPPAPLPEPPLAQARWSREKIASLVEAVEKSAPGEARLNACTDLLRIPAAGIPELLEELNLKNGESLSLVAKVLLIRWASDDGNAATEWAWKRFRTEGLWADAFREIGPSWAAHDPAGLGRWALSVAEKLKPDTEEPNMEEAASIERPFVDSGMLTDIAGWLTTEDPVLAYQLVRKRGGFSSKDMKMPSSMTSVADISGALKVFEDVKLTSPTRLRGDEIHVHALLQRWHEIDPGDFNRSAHAGSIITASAEESAAEIKEWKALPAVEKAAAADSMTAGVIPEARGSRISAIAAAWAESDPAAAVRWLDSLPPEDEVSAGLATIRVLAGHDLAAAFSRLEQLSGEQRRNSLVTAFDVWTKAHPGQRADRAGWPDSRMRAWEDLEALLPAGGR